MTTTDPDDLPVATRDAETLSGENLEPEDPKPAGRTEPLSGDVLDDNQVDDVTPAKHAAADDDQAAREPDARERQVGPDY